MGEVFLAECVESHVGLVSLGHLWSNVGQPEHARECLERSLAICRKISAPYPEGYALLGLAWAAEADGRPDEARALLEKALGHHRQLGRASRAEFALALLATLPRGDPGAAEAAVAEQGRADMQPRLPFVLWQATGKREYLVAARRLLDSRVESAPEAYRHSMRENVKAHRGILAASAALETPSGDPTSPVSGTSHLPLQGPDR